MNVNESTNRNTDLWLVARQSRQQKQSNYEINQALSGVVQSLRGQPTRTANTALAAAVAKTDGAICIDLSYYEEGQSLKPYHDAGATHAILRLGGPKYFQVDNWQLTEDKCYRAWFEEAKALGMHVGAYYVYSAGVDEQDYQNSENILDHIHQCFGGGTYKPEYLWIDDEVNYWYSGVNKKYATAVNQVAGIKILIDKCWKEFRIVTGRYSGMWFTKQNAEYIREYTSWLDAVNKPVSLGGPGLTVPSWNAWYIPPTWAYTNLREMVNGLPIPTSNQENSYLNIGYSTTELWQFAGDYGSKFGKADFSISTAPAAQFEADMGCKTVVTPPPPPVDNDDDTNTNTNIDLTALKQQVTDLTARVDDLTARLAAAKAAL